MAGAGSGHGESGGAILAAFLANLGIAVAKAIGFVITGSSALLAESIHSVADSSNQALLFLGGRRAQRPPTELHPFGFGRSRYFWAFVVSVVLFSVGGLFSAYEGIHKIQHPEEIDSPAVAFAIFGFAIVFEALALRTAVRHATPARGRRSWATYIRTSRSPELPVLLLEDSGALIGLLFATSGVGLAVITGNPVFDGIGTLAIGLLLMGIAVVLAIEMKSLLLGEAAAPEHVERIEAELGSVPSVVRIITVLTQHLGPDELLVAVKVELDHSLTVSQVAAAINECEREIREAVPIAKRIYIEPDLFEPELAGGAGEEE
ncbi:MAG TPA: cation diffusion facilitator family transporter [Solirubrobacterales bacterium]|nr:cation diffusion facilitator family transporter [Solirubrobacterales bacterium]